MEFVQTKDILERAAGFHTRLSNFYEQQERRVDQPKVKMLVHYLSRHEKSLADWLRRCELDSKLAVVNTWFKYKPDTLAKMIEDEYTIPADSTTEDVIKMALEFDDLLIEFYSDAANRAISVDVREFFENLVEQEEQEEHRLARATFDGF